MESIVQCVLAHNHSDDIACLLDTLVKVLITPFVAGLNESEHSSFIKTGHSFIHLSSNRSTYDTPNRCLVCEHSALKVTP